MENFYSRHFLLIKIFINTVSESIIGLRGTQEPQQQPLTLDILGLWSRKPLHPPMQSLDTLIEEKLAQKSRSFHHKQDNLAPSHGAPVIHYLRPPRLPGAQTWTICSPRLGF